MNFKLMKSAALAALASVCMAGAASAATLSVSDSFSGSTSRDVVLSVDMFDLSLGELTGVTVKVAARATERASATSRATQVFFRDGRPIYRTFTALAKANAFVQIAGPSVAFYDNSSRSRGCRSERTQGATCTVTAFTSAFVAGTVEISPWDFGPYDGKNEVDFFFRSGPGDRLTSASVEVTYTYTPTVVPLPAGGVLLLSGLALFAGAARTRKKKAA